MFVTWTALELVEPAAVCPWQPAGATFTQPGHGGAGRAEMPRFDGRWWSVLSTWPNAAAATAAAPSAEGQWAAWHVVLQPVSFHGDAVLGGGARPFTHLPRRGKVAAAAAVVTLAGVGSDRARGAEFFERFVQLGQDVRDAPGHRAALV